MLLVFDHDDGRYRGTPSLWDRIMVEPGKPIQHVHFCPECYEYYPCEMACALEPDLELDDGTPSGSHCECDRCGHDHG